jgi:hypothetical protein
MMQVVRDAKALLDQFDPDLPIIQMDRCSQTNVNPGRLKARAVHVYQYRSTGQTLLWVSLEPMRTNEEFVLVSDYEAVILEMV